MLLLERGRRRRIHFLPDRLELDQAVLDALQDALDLGLLLPGLRHDARNATTTSAAATAIRVSFVRVTTDLSMVAAPVGPTRGPMAPGHIRQGPSTRA